MDNLSQFTMDTDDQNAIDALLYLSSQSSNDDNYDNSITPYTYNSASNSPSQSSVQSPAQSQKSSEKYENVNTDNEMYEDNESIETPDFLDDGPVEYYETRMNDTLIGWTYTIHDKSICLTPPESWKCYELPYSINVSWYKRPLFYSQVHSGYFLSNSNKFMNKVEELGALFDPDRV